MGLFFKGDGKKNQLLRSSLELFGRVGYDRISVRDIAKDAGVSEAALYKHFSGKEEMAFFIFQQIILLYTQRVQMIVESDGSAIERLVNIQRYTYELYQEDRDGVSFALLSQYKFWDRLEDSLKPHFWMRSLLEEGISLGEIEKKPVYLWISLYSGLLLEPLIQYSFFADEFPEWGIFSDEISRSIEKLLKLSKNL